MSKFLRNVERHCVASFLAFGVVAFATTYLPLSGGIMSGVISIPDFTYIATIGGTSLATYLGTLAYLPLTGGVLSGGVYFPSFNSIVNSATSKTLQQVLSTFATIQAPAFDGIISVDTFSSIYARATTVTLQSILDTFAPLNNPIFSGVVNMPSTININGTPLSTIYAPSNSPTFTGTPTLPSGTMLGTKTFGNTFVDLTTPVVKTISVYDGSLSANTAQASFGGPDNLLRIVPSCNYGGYVPGVQTGDALIVSGTNSTPHPLVLGLVYNSDFIRICLGKFIETQSYFCQHRLIYYVGNGQSVDTDISLFNPGVYQCVTYISNSNYTPMYRTTVATLNITTAEANTLSLINTGSTLTVNLYTPLTFRTTNISGVINYITVIFTRIG